MKKLIATLLAICLLPLSGLSVKAYYTYYGTADEIFAIGDFMYSYIPDDNGVKFLCVRMPIGNAIYKETLYIPAEANGIPVIQLGWDGFIDYMDVQAKRIVLPPSVKTIGSYAFQNNQYLESINLENVTDIGEAAFEGCTSLRDVGEDNILARGCLQTLAFSRTAIEAVGIGEGYLVKAGDLGVAVFESCEKLRTVHDVGRNRNILYLPNSFFEGCDSLDYLCFDKPIYFYCHTFRNCKKLRTVVALNNISVSNYARGVEDRSPFEGVSNLTVICNADALHKMEEDRESGKFSWDTNNVRFIPAIINDGEPSTVVARAAQTATVRLNGYEIPAYTVNGSVYVGESALKSFGFGMDWDGEARTTTVTKPENVQWSVELDTNPEPYSLNVYSSDVKFMMNGFPIPYLCVGSGESIVDVNALAEAVLY